jgi:hypothetical protein
MALADVSAPAERGGAPARWLTAHDGLPAAAIDRGKIAAPSDGKSCSWIAVGSHWRQIDDLGRVVGEVRVTKVQKDEPWPCKMAHFSGKRTHARLLLNAEATPPKPTEEWTPSDEEKARLRGAIFFVSGKDQLAATADFVARQVGSAWQREKLERPAGRHYRDPAVIDLDGDGQPELVLGWWQDADYGELIFQRRDGVWQNVAESLPGNTI